MRKVGFISWRGMVGSVLMERMRSENDFQGFEAVFFTPQQLITHRKSSQILRSKIHLTNTSHGNS